MEAGLLLLRCSACAIMPGGKVPEWTIGAVSKTAAGLCSAVGSNPTLPACPRRGRVPFGGVLFCDEFLSPQKGASGEVA